MADFFKVLFPVFLSPTNYSEMLKKLASFLFYEVWIVTFFLREIPAVKSAFLAVENAPPIKNVISLIPGHESLNLTGVAIGLFIAGLSYATQLHDIISDIFRIRHHFDIDYILLPLARKVGKEITPEFVEKISAARDPLMREVFYKYASSRSESTIVDKHDIERALDGWSWYWILIEAMPITLLAAGIAAIFGTMGQIFGFLLAFACLLFFAILYSLKLRRLARPQVDAIASDRNARAAVEKQFDAL